MNFGSDFFAGNRSRLRQLFTGTAPIVLTANGLLQASADETFPFRQDSSFWYLTGCEVHDAILVIDKGREYLIITKREAAIEAFDGAVDQAALAARSGIQDIVDEKEGWRRLKSRLAKVQHVATLAANPPYIDFAGMYTNPARAALIRRIKKINPDVKLLDLRTHLARMRMIKQPVEMETIQRAIDITVETIKEVARPSRRSKYAYEYELDADISHGFRRRGADGQGFPSIIAGGPRACTMHYMDNNQSLVSDEMVVIDIGAGVSHYTADIARTITLSGEMSRRQQKVFQAVCAAQDHAFSLLKPGVMPKDYEKEMEAYIGEKLRELGLIKTITSDVVRDRFFPHRTSHYLGIDAHDAGDYDRPLEPGVVLAVEPGIYIQDEGIGVRIEDNVVITEDGMDILSKKLPREL